MWTFIIGFLLFSYVAFMIYKYVITTKQAINGHGCQGCSGNCNACDIVKLN